eukprot:8988684-Pyramimonas_sp.AAC.1
MYLVYTAFSAAVGDCSKIGSSSFLDCGRRAPYLHAPISASGGIVAKKTCRLYWVGAAVYLTCIRNPVIASGGGCCKHDPL